MLPLFTMSTVPRTNVSVSPGLSRLRAVVKDSVLKVQDYYRSNVRTATAAHPFAQMLGHMVPYQLDPIEVYNSAVSRYPYVSKALKFTTDFNRGTLQGHRVTNSLDTLIFATHDYVRPYAAVADWKSLKPVKYIWCESPFLDISPLEHDGSNRYDFEALSLDVPSLALMYKGFKESLSSESVLGADQFVGTHIAVSALESKADMSMISAAISMYGGTYEDNRRQDVEIYVPSYSSDVQTVLKHFLQRCEGTKMPFVQVLANLPCIYQENALLALQLPDYLPTTQVNWAMLAARLKVINFLYDLGGANGKRANQGFTNQLKKEVRLVRSMRYPENAMSSELKDFVENSLTRYEAL